ncbi:MAG TPA: hypothetical protein VMS14_00150 [Ilumatobacteraceae bacterium]|nr:hypothetical protein [Ilumatobacteraceae bacterium]HUC31777.1 hypothetical protein [Ilumatobacteraceae bacterium]
MKHTEFIHSLIHSVREIGAAATLDELRAQRPRFDRGSYHDTRAVFFVWAVDRLVTAGLSDAGVLWHPLVDERTPRVWWHIGVLESAAAALNFIPSTEAQSFEPQPFEPAALLAA